MRNYKLPLLSNRDNREVLKLLGVDSAFIVILGDESFAIPFKMIVQAILELLGNRGLSRERSIDEIKNEAYFTT